MAQVLEAAVVTDSQGAGTAWLGPVTGELVELSYTRVNYEPGAGMTVVSERTGRTIWSETSLAASKTVAVTASVTNSSGATLNNMFATYLAVEDRLIISVTGGGSSRMGVFRAVFRRSSSDSLLRSPAPGGIA